MAYKLFERLVYNRIKPVIESVLPHEQAGLRPNRYTLDQVALLAEDIENAFDKKNGIVLVDLSAAYDTLWHRGLTLKLLETIPSKQMVRAIMNMIQNRHFYVQMGTKSLDVTDWKMVYYRVRSLPPAPFNLYAYDMPVTDSKKYIYADDLALLRCDNEFKFVETVLSMDLDIVRDYFRKWRSTCRIA